MLFKVGKFSSEDETIVVGFACGEVKLVGFDYLDVYLPHKCSVFSIIDIRWLHDRASVRTIPRSLGDE